MRKEPVLDYLFMIAIISVIFAIIYLSVQQSYRSGANDPQIQIARDINKKLREGKSIERFFSDTIDINANLSPFVALFDDNGNPVRSSGFLDNKMPVLPAGVFEFAKSNGEHKVTWQPRKGVRMAMVIVSSNTSPVEFITSGRSLKEVEEREAKLVMMVFFGWIACIVLVLLHALLKFYRIPKPQQI